MHKFLPFIREKKEVVDAYQRYQPEESAHYLEWSRLEFVYTANLIEGSDLSRVETNQIITKGLTIGGKTLKEQNSAVADAQAVDWIRRSASLTRQDIDEQMMISLHHLLAGVENESGFVKYSYQVPYVLTEFTEWLHVQRASEVEVAVLAYKKLLAMKPFADRNTRTARLLFSLLLLMEGYPLVVIPEELVSQYLEGVRQLLQGEDTALIDDALYQSTDTSLEEYLRFIEKKQPKGADQLWKIGQLAEGTKETIPTIRYWVKQGLLKVAAYTDSGYQLFDPSMAERVIKIRQLQREERMKVAEIKGML